MLIPESCFVLLYRNKGRMDKKLCKLFAQVTCLHVGIIMILLLLACWGVMSTNDQHEPAAHTVAIGCFCGGEAREPESEKHSAHSNA